MTFNAGGKSYEIVEGLRDRIKPDWQEMLLPAKDRLGKIPSPSGFSPAVNMIEKNLEQFKETMVDKYILEVGCNEGMRSFLMAKFQDTFVHGIDVDLYTVDQSPDMNNWNPEDQKFVHDMFYDVRSKIRDIFPESVAKKVTFQTIGIEDYKSISKHNLVISWDTLEHIIDPPKAFNSMYECMVSGAMAYHEYNPFFALNGGHSLCTLDFLYGHCVLSAEDFERYVREIRPEEEKIDINFYHKCLNRATRADIRKYAKDSGFEILYFNGIPTVKDKNWQLRVENEILPEVQRIYPTVTLDDLICDSVQLVMRKP